MPKAAPRTSRTHAVPLTSTSPYALPSISAALSPTGAGISIDTTGYYLPAIPAHSATLPPIIAPTSTAAAPPPPSSRKALSRRPATTSHTTQTTITAPPIIASPTPTTTASTTTRKRTNKNNEDPLPWLSIKLDGEDEGAIPVYDSCNEIRRKIRAFFSNTSGIKCTQKRFLEVIGNVNCNSYRRFMALKGEGGGAENGTFYGAYVFFEKKRIYENKPKGKKRLESERDYPNGRPLSDDARHRWQIIGPGITPLSQKEIRMSVAKYGY